MSSFFLLLLCFLLISNVSAFYLPGIAMKEYAAGDSIPVLANKLTSTTNTLPFAYYSLPLCAPEGRLRSRPVNLGQILAGERSFPTKFRINMMQKAQCQILCRSKFSALKDYQFLSLQNRIIQNYAGRLNVDNMPLVTRYRTQSERIAFRFGYNLGFVAANQVYINNHLRLKILYHQPSFSTGEAIDTLAAEKDKFRIVGFEVEPFSVAHKASPAGATFLPKESCEAPNNAQYQKATNDQNVTFTYDIVFEKSQLAWATRWDPILDANADIKKIQWYSIVNSLMVSLFLTALVATVIFRTVLRDFGRYNAAAEADEEDDLTGWKYVHADVFRPPKHAPLLSVCVGSGAQVLLMALLTQLFALIGFLSPANRGGLLTALLSLWVLASAVSGYVSARLYQCIDIGVPRRLITFGSALLFPGITFGIFFLLNLVMWFVGSSGSVPFTTLLLILFMWFGISVPLVFIGAHFAYRMKPVEFPTRTNQIARQIPEAPFGLSPYMYALFAGVLPFGTVFMELVFILNSFWSGSVYYLYGALLAVFVILVITCGEMSIVSTYLSLSAEDWATHWYTSFWGAGSAGLYVFLYSLYFALAQPSKVQIPKVSIVVFVCWSLVVSGAFSLMCGTVGFFSSLWFTRKIYSSIRID